MYNAFSDTQLILIVNNEHRLLAYGVFQIDEECRLIFFLET